MRYAVLLLVLFAFVLDNSAQTPAFDYGEFTHEELSIPYRYAAIGTGPNPALAIAFIVKTHYFADFPILKRTILQIAAYKESCARNELAQIGLLG